MTDDKNNKLELITADEVARRTGTNKRFWDARRASGDSPPFIRIGHRSVRYDWEDVKEWLKKNKISKEEIENRKKKET